MVHDSQFDAADLEMDHSRHIWNVKTWLERLGLDSQPDHGRPLKITIFTVKIYENQKKPQDYPLD